MKLNRRLVPNLLILQTFECAARHGSFTQAGKELNLTQSGVSRHIKELETRLDLQLFDRVRQRVSLSAAGARLLPEARRLLDSVEGTMLHFMAGAQASNHLGVAAPATFSSRWLIPRLPEFLARHPDTVVSFQGSMPSFSGEFVPFDVAVHFGRPVWAHASCVYLCREVVLPVASPSLLRTHPVASAHDLAEVPLLHVNARSTAWEMWFDGLGLDTGAAYRGHHFDQFSMLIAAAASGMGAALLPTYLIENELQAGTLQVMLDEPLPTDKAYYLVVPENKADDPIVQAFCAWIGSQVSERSLAAGAVPGAEHRVP
ncbi:LysR family transcriptional regulator [Bordetella sp. BOR01]|uniref:LysR family transcriptional regulator n=1 Tax=Bordetella sp. BOR01 TaxID=2854779 RepID=UPI001C471706|nr:LysR family transcriptional regulator [Bordetella sp. BOR01]MBV7484447.1 LysR family transcriptional regulator [Bordetella sp. BOR01]